MKPIHDSFELREGLRVWVRVHLSRTQLLLRRKSQLPIPQPLEMWALIDTGAECSCVNQKVAEHLAPPQYGVDFDFLQAPEFGGLRLTTTLDVSWTIVHPSHEPADGFALRGLPVIAIDLPILGYDALLGRDVLSHLDFHYDGHNRKFTLSKSP